MNRILRRKQVEELTGLSRTTIYDRMKAGKFPRSIPLGGRAVGWLEQDIQAWIQQQVAAAGLQA
ncbi:MAG: AlpA family transcriptional regulator [Marinobacterium sp.]|nr:AlpA family transcriptional regulator [Marinobacterium sp.]